MKGSKSFLINFALSLDIFRCWQKAPRIDLHSNSHRELCDNRKFKYCLSSGAVSEWLSSSSSPTDFVCFRATQLVNYAHNNQQRMFHKIYLFRVQHWNGILEWNFNSLFELHNSKFQINIHCRNYPTALSSKRANLFAYKMHLRNFSTYFLSCLKMLLQWKSVYRW